MGRPRKEIDSEQFEKLCEIQCTKLEICAWFSVTDKTLDAWCKRTYRATFSEVYRQKRGRGKISLRRIQWQHAEKSASMAMFLGKQYLGQSDAGTVSEGDEIPVDPLSKSLEDLGKELDGQE